MTRRSGRRVSLAGATLLIASLAAPVAGGGGTSTTITNAVGGSFVQQGPAGLFAAACGEVGVELVPDPVIPVPWVWLTAFEFPLSSLPSGATIASAVLTLRDEDGAPPDTFHVNGYPGNGTVTTADMVPAGASVTYVANLAGPQPLDVTALITPAMVASGWAGFLVRPDTTTFDTVHHSLDCPGSGFPTLTITFGLPDAAMAPPVTTSPLAPLGLVLFLAGVGLLARRRERV